MGNIDYKELQYPIGHFQYPKHVTPGIIANWIRILEDLPATLENLVKHLTNDQLETPYRPGGWTVMQLVHLIADSHDNSFPLFIWALSEIEPLIKAYVEKDWSSLFDSRTAPINLSLSYIRALHAKLCFLLRGLDNKDLERFYVHPDGNEKVSVKENIGKYAWHSQHHCAHIKGLLERKGW